MLIKRKSAIFIPSQFRSEPFYERIKEFLFRSIRKYNTPDLRIVKFYKENDDFLILPRFFPIEKFVNAQISDISSIGKEIEIKHNITPRNEIQEKSIKHLLSHSNGILQLSPGVGKTVIAIYTICERKRKAFILVHKDALVDQWKDRLKSFTDLSHDDIAILNSSSFKEDLEKPIVIATAQMMISAMKRKGNEFIQTIFNSDFGTFFADEVHTTIGAEKFSECSLILPCKYVYGLSATPYRYDGNGDIIKFHLGDIFSDTDASDTMAPKIKMMMFDFGIETQKNKFYLYWEGQFQRSRYLKKLKNSELFMKILIDLIKGLSDRYLLCISERVSLIDQLFDEIDHPSKTKFISGSKLDVLSRHSLIFSTPGKIRDGVDCPPLDCLVVTSPVRNMEQLIGRVTRPLPDKKQPLVFDLVDSGCKAIKSTVFNRIKFYHEKGWDVDLYVFKDSKFAKIEKEEIYIALKEG